jgi:hypothetical protein
VANAILANWSDTGRRRRSFGWGIPLSPLFFYELPYCVHIHAPNTTHCYSADRAVIDLPEGFDATTCAIFHILSLT